jgi:hypothetical protein
MGKPDHSEKLRRLWLDVFSNSKVNGAEYREDRLPSHAWSWPTDTYLQCRLRELRTATRDEPVIVAQNPTLCQPASRDDGMAAQPQSPGATRKPADNANRPNRAATKQKGLVIEWEDIDERLSWFARPSNN